MKKVVAFTVNLGKINDLEVEMIRNPKALSDLEKWLLVKELNQISKEAFGKEDVPFEETFERTIGVETIYLLKKDGRILGYATNDTLTLAERTVNYFSSALFKPEIQNSGLYKTLNELRVQTNPSEVIMTRTQNPMVINSFSSLCHSNGLSFNPNGAMPDEETIRIARAYCPSVQDDLICRGVYGRPLMRETPKPVGESVKICSKLEVEAGDAVILIGM